MHNARRAVLIITRAKIDLKEANGAKM